MQFSSLISDHVLCMGVRIGPVCDVCACACGVCKYVVYGMYVKNESENSPAHSGLINSPYLDQWPTWSRPRVPHEPGLHSCHQQPWPPQPG